MNHVGRKPQLMKSFFVVTFLIGITLLQAVLGATKIHAQSSDDWSDPVNLSQSGSSNNPILVVDSDGTFHVVWDDEFAGYKYVTGDRVEWSQAVAVNLPFMGAVPELLADKEGFIHAFWKDDSNGLYYSSVRATDFALASAWTPPVQLGESAFDIGISLDQNGDIHLSYIRPLDSTEFPAGVYYRKLVTGDAGWVWSLPVAIYTSPYFRSIELADTNVDIATSLVGSEEQIYAVWDNRPRERVYLAISKDGGQTWGSAEEVDKPDSASGYNNTGEILVDAHDQDVFLMWQRSSPGGFCSQYFQQSGDGGETWSRPEEVISESLSCGQDEQLLRDGNAMLYLWTLLQNQVTLVAWDGQQWSNPQVQNELSAFTDFETEKSVTYDCRRPVMNNGDRLAVVGCDSSGGGDIWFTDRQLDDVDNWFSGESNWSEAQEFVSGQSKIESPVLVAAPDNDLLALWSQVDRTASEKEPAAIHIAVWNGDSWTASVLTHQSPQASLTQPSAAIDAGGQVMAVWSASGDGKIYFSQANVDNAHNPAEWSEPMPLPISQALANSPKILVSRSGAIYVAYAVPVNEGRGIYVTRSVDRGETWSSPVQIFDGVAAGWQIVDSPQLVETPDGVLHALWSPRSISDNSGLLGLYYGRSEDGGNTWIGPQAVTDEGVMWSQMASTDQGHLFRVWQEGDQLQPVIKYQYSSDSGLTWTSDESLGSFGEKSLMAKLVMAPAGNLHMLQMVQDSSGDLILRDWLWESEHWSVNEYFDLTKGFLEEASAIEATASRDGNLAVIFSAKAKTQPGDRDIYGMFFTNRSVGLPADESALPIVTATIIPAQSVTDLDDAVPLQTPVAQSTPISDQMALVSNESPASSGSSFMGVGRGVMLAVLMIGVVVVLGVWKVRSGR